MGRWSGISSKCEGTSIIGVVHLQFGQLLVMVEVPVGRLVCPWELSPQQVTVPAVRIAQAWTRPAAIVVNFPVGG